jgi:hypothetical protein
MILERWRSLDQTTAWSGKKPPKPAPPLSLIGGWYESLRQIKDAGPLPAWLATWSGQEAVAGDMGVLRKTATRAATRSETAIPPTQAVQPNMSKMMPSTALPIRPPKK